MNETIALLALAGNIALLLWGLQMVKTGVMQAFGANIHQFLRAALNNRFKAFISGLGITTLLQSSTAVGLMTASFAASGLIDLIPGLAVMLGANVGTTMIVQLLSFDISRGAPVLVLAGAILFKKGVNARFREMGQAIIGLGLMLLGLEQIIHLLHAAADSETMHLLLKMIMQDSVLSVLVSAIITWAMHSSVAMVLLSMSLVSQNLITLKMALALTLGANLGSAINPIFETPSGNNPAIRRLPFGNMFNRLVGCVVLLPLLSLINLLPASFTDNTAHAVANFHSIFNIGLAIIFFPLLPWLARALTRLLPDKPNTSNPAMPVYLDVSFLETPVVAVANAARETMRMGDIAETMLHDIKEALAHNDAEQVNATIKMDDTLDQIYRQIKFYLTSVAAKDTKQEQTQRINEVFIFATNLEHVGDIIINGLTKLAHKKISRNLTFSPEGWEEIKTIFDQVKHNISLATAVFMTSDISAARQLAEAKGVLNDLERNATQTHFERLREGRPESVDTSALHLDILRDLKRINSHLAGAALQMLKGQAD